MIPYGRQEISDEDILAVSEVLRSDWLTQGPAIPAFESAVARTVGARHAVAVNSATSALHIACLALGLGPGDLLWTTPNTFVASANCAVYCGAQVDFVDISAETLNIDVAALRAKLETAARNKRLPKVLVPVHFGGLPTDQQEIWNLAQEYGVAVIEDASHSIGAENDGEPAGSCRWADIAVFSFHPVKIITSGEGGMCLTNNEELAFKMSILRTHGITRESNRMTAVDPAPWVYEQIDLGYNYRMTDIHAVLGSSQLLRLDQWIEQRNVLADRYKCLLDPRLVQWQMIPANRRSAYHLFVVKLVGDDLRSSHRQVFESMRNRGIAVNLHYTPVHLQPFYRRRGFGVGMFPIAEDYASRAMSIPMFPSLSQNEQDFVVDTLHDICRNV